MLVDASNSTDENIASIPPLVSAILFFGTPHHGSSLASSSLIFLRLMSIFGVLMNKKLLTELQGTGSLERLNHDFFRFLNASECRVYSFYEMKKTTGLGGVIVTKDAAFLGHPKERLSGVASTHADLVKFESINDITYSEVIAAIVQSIEEYAIHNPPKPADLGDAKDHAELLPQGIRDYSGITSPEDPSSSNPSPIPRRAPYALQSKFGATARAMSSIRREPTARFVFDTLSESEAAETGR